MLPLTQKPPTMCFWLSGKVLANELTLQRQANNVPAANCKYQPLSIFTQNKMAQFIL